MKQIFLLLVLSLGMLSINVSAQKRFLMTEDNGFQWYIIYKDGISGAEGKDGRVLIPLSRGYNTIMYEAFKNGKGHFLVIRDLKYGACDIMGREIIAPDKYDFVNYHEVEGCVGYYTVSKSSGVGACDITGKEIIPCRYDEVSYSDGFIYKTTYDGDYIRTNIKLDKQTKSDINTYVSSSSSTRTPNKLQSSSDAQYFGLKGNVKKCKWFSQATPLENFPWFEKEIQFSRQGKIILEGYKLVRESTGRIVKIEKDLNTYRFYYDSNNRINCIENVVFNIFGEDLVCKYYYTYDSQGRIISSNFDYDALGKSVFDYKNFVNDSKGNWIKCNSSTTYKKIGRQEYTPKREITYY